MRGTERQVGRYLLDDLVAESAGEQTWRATDPALARPVWVRILRADDPRADRFRSAAQGAAAVHDRRLVGVLDVLGTPEYEAVVTEWAIGTPWAELLGEPWADQDCLVVAYEIARALQTAHRSGVYHGRLRPRSVIISDSKHVRLRGLAVDAALRGVTPVLDPAKADIYGVGALLFSGLTRKWPGPIAGERAVDGLPIAARRGGGPALPAHLMAGVPDALNTVVARCFAVAHPGLAAEPFASMDEVVDALGQCLEGPSAPAEDKAAGTDDTVEKVAQRGAVLMVAALAILAVVALGMSLLATRDQTAASTLPTGQAQVADDPSRRDLGAREISPIPVLAARDFDPDGRDQQENPDLVPLALDGDPETAWQTVVYRNSGMDSKEGTGLLLDLGVSRPVRGVSLQMLGTGTDVSVYVGRRAGTSVADFTPVASVIAAGEDLQVRTPLPLTARYVVVWLTNLPYTAGGYQGGIRELDVLG